MKLKAKAAPIDLNQFDRDSLITRAKAVRLIARTVRREDESDKQACNRVSQRFTYATRNGRLPRMVSGKFVFGELAAWTQDTWRGKFLDWPALRISTGRAELKMGRAIVEGVGTVLPADLPMCHEHITALSTEVAALRRENAALQREVEELRLLKVRDEAIREARRKAGKEGGRGRAK